MAEEETQATETDEVEGHLLKEALAAGAAAGAMITGAASAPAQNVPGDGGASAARSAPNYAVDPGGGQSAGRLEPGPSGPSASKPAKRPSKKRR